MFAIGCHLSCANGYLAMGQTALAIGANTFQFFTRNPRGGQAKAFDKEDAASFRQLAAKHRFAPLLAHAPYTINPCSDKAHVRQFALETMTADLTTLAYLPEVYYNFHPGSHMGQSKETGIELIAATLNAVIDPKQKTMVLLETMVGKGSELGGSFAELQAILQRIKVPEKVGVCLDTCHVFAAGYDIANDLDGVLAEFDQIIGLSKLKAIHLNDSMHELGSRKDRHAQIGAGQIGLKALTRIVNHPKLKGLPFELETPNELPGYAAEITLLRNAYRA